MSSQDSPFSLKINLMYQNEISIEFNETIIASLHPQECNPKVKLSHWKFYARDVFYKSITTNHFHIFFQSQPGIRVSCSTSLL